MKARLLTRHGATTLLSCNGSIKILSNKEATDFMMNFENSKYYDGDSTWDYEISIEDYSGDTIAYVSDDNVLHIVDAIAFRNLFELAEPSYITVQEYADLHGKKAAIVRRLCANGRIQGATQKGKTWLIPPTSPYPSDERIRH